MISAIKNKLIVEKYILLHNEMLSFIKADRVSTSSIMKTEMLKYKKNLLQTNLQIKIFTIRFFPLEYPQTLRAATLVLVLIRCVTHQDAGLRQIIL